MDWELHIQKWSDTAARLVDIRRISMMEEAMPERYDAPTVFFVVVTQGEAKIALEGTVYLAASPYILHGGKGAELRFITTGNAFSCYLILYEDTLALEEHAGLRVPYSFAPYSVLPLREKCQTMLRLWRQADPMDKLQAQSAFLSFVYEFLRQARTTAEDKGKPNLVSEAVRYLNEHYKEPITADELAGMQGCSASYLSRLFKNQLGMGPIDYLIHVRVFKAKQLLTDSEARIQEVAKGVGYADVYYFSRLFKKHVGVSPLQFRDDRRRSVQNNPLSLSKSSIVTPKPVHHNENESYYQLVGEGDTSMFRFSRPAFGVMMLLCTALILSACQAGTPAPSGSQTETSASRQPDATATPDPAMGGASGETRKYTHLNGESEIPVKPQRVVSLYHLGEIMALGVEPVGATPYILSNPFLDDVSGITDVGVPPDLEKILALEPDLIVTTAPFAEVVEGGYEALKRIAPTIVVEQHNDPIKDVEMFGDILGKQEDAKAWNEGFTAKIAEYKEKMAPFVEAGETFSILNVRPGSVFIYGDTNMGGNIIYKYLGFKPTEKVESEVINGETWEISAETIPEFIGDRLFLAVNEGAEEDMKKVEKLLQSTPAGKTGKIYPIDFDQFLLSDPISVDRQLDIIANLLMDGNQ